MEDESPICVRPDVAQQLASPLAIRHIGLDAIVEGVALVEIAIERIMERGAPVTRRAIIQETGIHKLVLQYMIKSHAGLRELVEMANQVVASDVEEELVEIALAEEDVVVSEKGGEFLRPNATPARIKAMESILKGRSEAYRPAGSQVTNTTTVTNYINEQKILSVGDAQDYFTRQRLERPASRRR